MSDCIRLNSIKLYGYHGVSIEEQKTGRHFEVDCELELDLTAAGRSDKLEETVNYDEINELILKTCTEKKFKLLETLAETIASLVLDNFPVKRVTLRVRKLHPPVAGLMKHVEVEISRP